MTTTTRWRWTEETARREERGKEPKNLNMRGEGGRRNKEYSRRKLLQALVITFERNSCMKAKRTSMS
jgi:hypothetical protein